MSEAETNTTEEKAPEKARPTPFADAGLWTFWAAAAIASERTPAGAPAISPQVAFAKAASLRASGMVAPFLEDEQIVPVHSRLSCGVSQKALDNVELEAANARHVI